jgi:hypothetical protein
VAGCLAETWPASAGCVDRGPALVKGSYASGKGYFAFTAKHAAL